jgi:DNA-binding NarL/FixJ family response regulator
MNKITILISDDHAIVRAGLRLLLEADGDILVVGEATNGHEAVREAKRLRPNVVLLDLAMPLLNGLQAARQIIKEVPRTEVLVLSAYSDDLHVRPAVQAGVTGYLVKETAGNDLLQAVREACRGNAFFSPSISKHLLPQRRGTFLNVGPAKPDANSLTRRQAEVFQLIAEGYMTKQIATVLSLSVKTVEKHRQRLMDTLDIHDIATLTRYAVSSGIIESGPGPQSSRATTAQVPLQTSVVA